jgi:hypothetical protein
MDLEFWVLTSLKLDTVEIIKRVVNEYADGLCSF